jgi:ferredoxin-like protein FixX
VEVCPHEVFALQNHKAVLRDFNACMECGACKMNCPAGAIDVRPGVGCAYAIILGKLRGTSPDCGCGGDTASACCG